MMTKEELRIAKLIHLASESAFYRNEDGMFRMQTTDIEVGHFLVLDEDSGEEYWVEAEDVKDSDCFYKLQPFPASVARVP